MSDTMSELGISTHLTTGARAGAARWRSLHLTGMLVRTRHAMLRRIAPPLLIVRWTRRHVAAMTLRGVSRVHSLILRAIRRVWRVGRASLRNGGIYWNIWVRRYATRIA